MSTNTDADDEVPKNSSESSHYDELLEIQAKMRDDGRVTIPEEARQFGNIDHNDVVDVSIEAPHCTFESTDIVVDSDGRIRIPSRKRRIYGLEGGEMLRVTIGVRGEAVSDLP